MTIKDHIKVSVCMITYNHDSYIKQAIEGVLMQECDCEVELIIANDNSPDNTENIVNDIIKNHPKGHWIKYTRHPINKGMMPNFIWALSQAKGEYIALCEGDDYWTDPLKLQKQVDFLEENENCSLTCHTVGIDVYGSNKIKPRQYITEDRYLSNNEIITANGHLTPTLSYVFRSKYLLNLPTWSLKAPVGDIPLAFFLMMQGRVYSFCDSMGVYRSELPGSWSMNKKKAKLSIRLKHRIKYNAFIQCFNKFSNKKYTDELNIHLGKRDVLSSLIINTASFIYRKLCF